MYIYIQQEPLIHTSIVWKSQEEVAIQIFRKVQTVACMLVCLFHKLGGGCYYKYRQITNGQNTYYVYLIFYIFVIKFNQKPMPMHMPINSEDIWYLLKMYILFSIPLLFIFWVMLWTKRCNMSAVRAGERYGNAAVDHTHFVIYKNVEKCAKKEEFLKNYFLVLSD